MDAIILEYLELDDIELHHLEDTFSRLSSLKALKAEIRFQKEIGTLLALLALEQLEIKQTTSGK